MSRLVCVQVTARYNGTDVLHGIDLSVHAGEWVALIGPNGAGKSTLLRSIAGVMDHGGAVTIDGVDTRALGRRKRAQMVAMVPQQPAIPTGMSVADYALLGRNPYLAPWAMESPMDVRRVTQVLDELDLTEMAGRSLDQLSGGELQRAVLARALTQDAGVLLLDEPTAALDLGHQRQVLELVDTLRRRHRLAVVAAFHDITLAAQYADRIAALDNGTLAIEGHPDDVVTPEVLSALYHTDVTVVTDHDGARLVALRRERRQEPAKPY